MIKGMDHVGMSVRNLDRSIEFYRNLFGMELIYHGPFGGEHYDLRYESVLGVKGAAGTVALMRLGTMQIEMFQFDRPDAKLSDPHRPVCDHGITHFCFQVRDVPSEYERLKAAGVRFHCAPQHFDGKAVVTYGRDPDGNVFELLELFSAE